MKSSNPHVFVICGPSGVGKGTLIDRFQKQHADTHSFAVSHTTRPKRAHEVEGVHYHFVGPEYFDANASEFVETVVFNGNRYGCTYASVESVLNNGKHCIMDLDLRGCAVLAQPENLRRFRPQFLFVMPPNGAELERRLRSRGTDTEESICSRLEIGKRDMEEIERLWARRLDTTLITNDQLDMAYAEFEHVLMKTF